VAVRPHGGAARRTRGRIGEEAAARALAARGYRIVVRNIRLGGVEIELCERHSVQRGEIHSRVPGEFLRPYVHQRYDNLSPVGEE